VQVVFFDVDGVFTDGRLVFTEAGEGLKQFNVLDGLGVKHLRSVNITPVVISGRSGEVVKKRMTDLGVEHIFLGVDNKRKIAEQVLNMLNLNWSQAAAIGDDWPDLHVLTKSAFSSAPANAHIEVRQRVHFVSSLRGGEGAVRDVCDLLVMAKGRYQELLNKALID
jgi:3-deoxy-D-manno-octulosonate 8-phosphate phosphatase (KDO 8-P phosphatase)